MCVTGCLQFLKRNSLLLLFLFVVFFLNQVAFRLYDQDKDGFISKEEMLLVVSGLYKMLGDLATLQGNDYDSPEKLVARLFLEMDKERKGAICFEQFRAFALKDQSIIMSLGLGI